MNYKKSIRKKEDYQVSNWSGGKTTQMYIYPEDSDYKKGDFNFRISSATVELPESDFTKLQGVNRFITTLDGHLKLTHDYKNFIELKPFQVYEFSGEIETHSYGKVQDFNLMLSNGARGKLKNIELSGEKTIDISNREEVKEFHIFYCPEGDVSIFIEEESLLEKGDLLIVEVDRAKALNLNLKSRANLNILYSKISIG